jgi:hypothetical protein
VNKVGKVTKAKRREGETNQLPKAGPWWIELVLWDWGWYLNCPNLLGEELTRRSCSCRAMQLPPGENIRSDHFAQTCSDLSQVPVANCPVERRNQIMLISQSLVRPLQSSCLQWLAHKTKERRKI